jgi:hypothetical protein
MNRKLEYYLNSRINSNEFLKNEFRIILKFEKLETLLKSFYRLSSFGLSFENLL